MATLDEIERSWGYDDSDWDDDDDDPDDDLYNDDPDWDDDYLDGYVIYRRTRHVCTIYTICDACGKLEYATGARWWTAANLCQCLPF